MYFLEKRALFFILVVALFSCKKSPKKESNTVIPKTTISFSKENNVEEINQLLLKLDSNIILQNSTQIHNISDYVYYKLDSLESIKSFSKKGLTNYFEILTSILEKGYTIPNIKKICKEKNAEALQYIIYLHYQEGSNELLIKNYLKLEKDSLLNFVSPSNHIKRLIDLGVAYNKIGDQEKTEKTYREALELAKREGYANDYAKALVNLNIILLQKKQYDSVIIYSNSVFKKAIEPIYKSSLCLNLADAYIEKGNPDVALQHCQKSFTLLSNISSKDKVQDYEIRLSNTYKSFANIYSYKNDYPKADVAFNNALKHAVSYDSTGREMAKLYIAIGKHKQNYLQSLFVETPLMFYNKALKALQQNFNEKDSLAIPDLNTLTAENTYFEALDAKADYLNSIALKTKRFSLFEKIIDYYTVAFKVERLLLNNFIYDNSKIEFLDISRSRTKKALEICSLLHKETRNKNWINKAFQFIENSKATVLLEKMKQNNILQSMVLKDSVVLSYKNEMKKLSDFLEQKNTSNNHADINIDSAIEKSTKEVNRLKNFIKEKYPQLNQLFTFEDNYTIEQVQARLSDKDVLINYFYMDTTIYSIVLTPQNVMFNTNTTDPTIINAYKSKCADLSFQINQPKQFIDLSFNVYQQILQANLVNEKSNNIIILPDGILNGLSFDALITKKSSITNYKVQAFLVKKYQTQYGFSYGSLLQKSNTKTINNNVMMSFAPATNSALPNKEVLHFSLDEANAIKMIFPKTLLFLDSQATKQNFINNYRNCSIIHLSTHSEADPFLGNSSIDFYDTKMVANQFYTHDDFKAKLVFLSACETIVGKQTASEGVLSLARSIYYAGAQNVISSQWIINDESTKILVSHFYKNLDDNQYATALQNAKQIYIKQCSPEKAAPFYWASLCNIGVNLQIKKSTNYWWLIIGLISVVLIFISITKNRKNT